LTARLLGVALIVLGVASGGFAALMTFGALLEFSAPGVAYAVLFWVTALALIAAGVRMRRAR
jgi:hypothetical protein